MGKRAQRKRDARNKHQIRATSDSGHTPNVAPPDSSSGVGTSSRDLDAAQELKSAQAVPDWLRRYTELRPISDKMRAHRVAVTSRGRPSTEGERHRWLFPEVAGDFDGIDLAYLDPGDPDDRHILILAEHPDYADAIKAGYDEIEVDGVVINPRLHVTSHEIVCNQVWDSTQPEIWTTVRRLRRLGYERHEILHMLGSVVMEQLYGALHDGRTHDSAAYAEALADLPESWLEETDEPT